MQDGGPPSTTSTRSEAGRGCAGAPTTTVAPGFVTGLQQLPPQQRTVLVLRDVLGFPAAEVADILDTSTAAVNSALIRARHGLRPGGDPHDIPLPKSPAEAAIVDRFVDALEHFDLDRLVALLTQDARLTMPPEPFEFRGPRAIAGFLQNSRSGSETSSSSPPAQATSPPSSTTSPTPARRSGGPAASWCSRWEAIELAESRDSEITGCSLGSESRAHCPETDRHRPGGGQARNTTLRREAVIQRTGNQLPETHCDAGRILASMPRNGRAACQPRCRGASSSGLRATASVLSSAQAQQANASVRLMR
ncbi:sigma factor-like helix-turn-helix DNA-binding protein [Streptomyces sp. NPDC102270]|uniref:sigma factor-like helix-turn-helix DNA-binding protein n=1 Tax=Streptomyces sp. NPDC102270 TaxID=3366150 RepID=UPI0037FADC0F